MATRKPTSKAKGKARPRGRAKPRGVQKAKGKKTKPPAKTKPAAKKNAKAQQPEKKAKAEKAARYFSTIRDACEHFSTKKHVIAYRSFVRRKDEPLYPKKHKLGYRLEEVESFLVSAGMFAADEGDLNKDQEMAKKYRVSRQQMEFDLKAREGLLMEREEHRGIVVDVVQLFIGGLEDLRQRVATRIRNPKVQKVVEECIKETRGRLSERVANGS